MDTFLFLVGCLYTVPFVLATIMPGWRSWSAFAAASALLTIWAISDLRHADGPGAALGAILTYAMIFGLVCGVATRAVTLLVAGWQQAGRFVVVTLSGFAAVPALCASLMGWEVWSNRLPSATCLAAATKVRIAGAVCDVPHAPLFTVAEARGSSLSVERIGVFERHSSGHWTAPATGEGAWLTPSGEPFTFHCNDIHPAGTVHCQTTYDVGNGAQVTYRFRARASAFEADAKVVDTTLQSLLSDLRVKT